MQRDHLEKERGKIETKKKSQRSRLLLITSQTGDLAFHLGRFPYFSSCPGLCLRVKTNQRHLYVEDCWPLKEPSQFRPACCVFSPLLLFFSFLFPLPLPSLPVCFRSEGLGHSFKPLYFSFLWDLNMHTEVLVQSMLLPFFLILLSFIEDSLLQSVR